MNVEQKRTACARLGLQAWTIGDTLHVDGKLPTVKEMEAEWARHEFEVANKPKSEVELLKDRIAELEASLVKTDTAAGDLKTVLIDKAVIKESDFETVKEVK